MRALLVFWIVAFVAWEARFSILRYAALLELLAGIPLALVLAPLGRARSPAMLAGAVSLALFTVLPDWGRASGKLVADVRPPAFEPGSLVLLLDPAPMAYVAAFSSPEVRFAGANSNLLRPGEATIPAVRIAEAIAAAPILWGLESPADQPGEADRALAAYHLTRAGCVRVASNLDADAILACRLQPSNRPRMTSLPSPPSPALMAMPASASNTRAANMRGISSLYPASRMR